MEDKDLKKILGDLKGPKPDEARKAQVLKAAKTEFEQQGQETEDRIKGLDNVRRLTDRRNKNLSGGTPVMRKKIYAAIGLAAMCVVIVYGLVTMNPSTTIDVTRGRVANQVEQPRSTKDSSVPEVKVEGGKGSASIAEQEKPASKPAAATPVELSRADADKFNKGQVPATAVVDAEEAAAGAHAQDNLTGSTGAVKKEALMAAKRAEQKADYRANYGAAGAVNAPSPMSAVKAKSADSMFAPPTQVHDRVEYAGRDKFDRTKINPVKKVSEEQVSTFSIDVDTASYAFVRRSLNEGHLPQKDAVRIEEMVNYFDYDYEAPNSADKPFKPTIAVYPAPWNKGNKLVHIGIKAREAAKDARPRANLTFLVDVSGSMSPPDRLPLLITSLKMMVNDLRPDDTVAIAVYAGAAGEVLPPTKISNKAKIIEALDRLHAGGSTAGGEGIKLAYSIAEANFDKDAINRVILATDGDFNVGIRNSDELKGFVERKRESGITLSVLGFGMGNYNDEMMQKLAQNGNGNAAYIDTLNEARKVLVEQAGATLFTVAKDVKIQVEFNPKFVSEYRLIGYETRMLKREDFNNDKIDAGDVGAGHSVTAIYEITPVGSSSALIDPLRYGSGTESDKSIKSSNSEYAYLKIRYKLPKEEKSRLIDVPIDSKVEYGEISKAPVDVRFAASVAGFAQILKGGEYTGTFSYDNVIELGRTGRGEDKFGYRAEFLNLVRLAKGANAMGNR